MKVSSVFNDQYFGALLQLLKKAETSIDLMSFSFAIGSAAGRINKESSPYKIADRLKTLKDEAGSQLRIRLYIEGFRETSQRNKVTADFLEDAGISVKFGQTHAKGICIDGQFVLFGSTNLTEQSISKNNEANLLISGEQVASEFTRYFNYLWRGGKHGGIHLEPPLLADGDFKNVLIKVIDRAKKTIEFSIYFFSHKEIEEALVSAYQRGVRVTGFIHQHNSFALDFVQANRATLKRLNNLGLRHLFLSHRVNFSHSKYLVADKREIMLGTGNWLVQDVTTHPQLYIHLKNQALGEQLSAHCLSQIQALSRR